MRLICAVVLLAACGQQPAVDRAAAEAELLAAHAAVLAQHRAGDWEAIAGGASELTLDVSNGMILKTTRDDARTRFQGYFERATFTRYEDESPPIARVSLDGSLGWVIAKVRVEGRYRGDDGVTSPLDTTWAWLELYERAGGAWQRVGTVSTRTLDGPDGLAGLFHAVDPGAAQVLAAAEDALGGRPALRAIESVRTRADVTTPRGPASTRITATADGRVRFDQTTSSGGVVVITVVGDDTRAGEGVAATPGTAEQRVVAIGHALHVLLISPTRLLAGGTDGGNVEFGGRGVRALDFVDAAGNPVRVFYDPTTHLPLGAQLIEPGSAPPEPIRVTVDDWRWLGTVQMFHRATFEHRGERYEHAYTEIRFNDDGA